MGQQELREIVVRAAMPLLGEYDTLTTARIARAAGIDERALLAEFDDKDAVLRACMATMRAELEVAFDPSAAVQQLDAIPPNQPLATRLATAIDIMDSYYDRVRTRVDGIHQATSRPAVPSASRADFRAIGGLPEIRQALARLLEPDREQLRLPPDVLAEVFVAAAAARSSRRGGPPLSPDQIVDLFLHGAQTPGPA